MTRRSVLIGLSLGWAVRGSRADAAIVLATGAEAPLGPGTEPGFADSIAIEAFRRIGIRASVIVLPAERALINANEGIEDGDALRSAAIEGHYRNLVRVPETVMLFEMNAYSFDHAVRVEAMTDLSDRSVGFVTGMKMLEQSLEDHDRLTLVKAPRQLFGLLVNRRIDVAIAERWQGNWWVKRLRLDCRVVPVPLPREQLFIYLHKRHAALVPALSAALSSMKTDGTYARIFLKTLAPLDTVRP